MSHPKQIMRKVSTLWRVGLHKVLDRERNRVMLDQCTRYEEPENGEAKLQRLLSDILWLILPALDQRIDRKGCL